MTTRNTAGIGLMGATLWPLVESGPDNDMVEAYRLDLGPDARSPKHSLRSWKLFIVSAGTVVIGVDGIETDYPAGAVVFVPAGHSHCYRNTSGRDARLVVITDGHEQLAFLRGISAFAASGPIDPQQMRALAEQHGVRMEPV